MPCYEPPPPWEGKEKKNAQEAVKILCAYVGEMLDKGLVVKKQLLLWFLTHREIDLEIATTGYYGKLDAKEAEKAREDIRRTKKLLASCPQI